MKRVIITGSTGILGTALISLLSTGDTEITAVVRPGSSRRKMIREASNIKIIECPLEKIENLTSMVSGKFDSFYHLGWTNTDREGRRDQAKQDLNIQYSLDSLKTAKKIGCDVFLGAGSQAEYGRYDVPISEEFEPMPETAYGRSKLLAGKVTSEFASKIGIKHVWTRIFSAYGPHDAASTMIMYCIDRLLKNEKVGLTACTQTWDYLYCMDAARAIVSVAEKGKNNRVYNIGSGIGRELKEYVKIITDLMEVRQEIEFGVIKAPEGGLMNLTADISRISRDTGFNPLVGFEEGIKETIKWHKENYQ